MRAAFDRSARINNVYPVQPVAAGGFLNPLRPSALGQRNSFTYGPSSEHYPDSAFPDIKNRSWRAEVTFETSGAKPSGTLIAQGGRLGGWGVRLDQGRPEMIYTVGPATSDRTVIKAEAPFSMGQHQLSVEFTYDGAGLGKGGEVRLLAGREVIAAGRVPATVPFIFQEGASIGRDYGTSLAPDYEIPDVFEGSIKNVKLQIGPVGSANKAGPASTSGK
jgi:arylsulfatase